MNEKDLEHLLQPEEENTEIDKKIREKIKKGIRKQIYTRIVIVLAAAALILTGGAFGLSALLNASCYNPRKVTPAIQEDGGYYDFHILMETFLGLYYPDIIYVPVTEQCTANGFGSYDVGVKIQSFFDPLAIDGYNNVTFHIDRSNLNIESTEKYVLTIWANEFLDKERLSQGWGYYDFEMASVSQELISEIEELPDSCTLKVSISFGDPLSLEDAIAFMDRYDHSAFHWLAINMNGSTPDGIALYNAAGYNLTEETKENYPNLYLDNDFTADDLRQAYLSRLKLLLDHKDFMGLLTSCYNTTMTIPHIQDQYEEVEKNEITAIGVRASVKKQDLLDMIEQDEIPYVIIHDVKLSSWQR